MIKNKRYDFDALIQKLTNVSNCNNTITNNVSLDSSKCKHYTLDEWNKLVASQPKLYSNVEKQLLVQIPGIYGKTEPCKVPIDTLIYNTIKTLNDKGYLTMHCCSGHAAGELSEITPENQLYVTKKDVDKEFAKSDGQNIISINCYSCPYITFAENYDFNPKPPVWFELDTKHVTDDNHPNNVSYYVHNYCPKIINGETYTVLLLNDELVQLNKELEDWANSLPDNNKKRF